MARLLSEDYSKNYFKLVPILRISPGKHNHKNLFFERRACSIKKQHLSKLTLATFLIIKMNPNFPMRYV